MLILWRRWRRWLLVWRVCEENRPVQGIREHGGYSVTGWKLYPCRRCAKKVCRRRLAKEKRRVVSACLQERVEQNMENLLTTTNTIIAIIVGCISIIGS